MYELLWTVADNGQEIDKMIEAIRVVYRNILLQKLYVNGCNRNTA